MHALLDNLPEQWPTSEHLDPIPSLHKSHRTNPRVDVMCKRKYRFTTIHRRAMGNCIMLHPSCSHHQHPTAPHTVNAGAVIPTRVEDKAVDQGSSQAGEQDFPQGNTIHQYATPKSVSEYVKNSIQHNKLDQRGKHQDKSKVSCAIKTAGYQSIDGQLATASCYTQAVHTTK